MKKVTLSQIAEACGVTKGAVSRALADKYNVSPETTYAIKQKALELGYNFNKLKINKEVSKKVLILCPSRLFFKEDFWQTIIKAASDRLSKSMINTEFFIYDENNIKESLINLKKAKYKGFIVIHYDNEELMDELSKCCVPTVIIDPKYDSQDGTLVRFSNYASFKSATNYLIKLGHKRIMFYGSNSHSTSFKERYDGYCSAINDKKEINHIELDFDNKNRDYAADNEFKKIIQDFKPTAVLCANDLIAISAYKVIKSLGLKIPDDISIIGFDNVKESERLRPKLSTFDIPLKEIGDEAAGYLIKVLQKNKINYAEVVVRCEFIERESVKEIK